MQNIVRPNVYHTNTGGFFEAFPVLQKWTVKHQIKEATTVVEIKTFVETLTVQLEATVVR